jgi:Zn-dependent protease with chaperone function
MFAARGIFLAFSVFVLLYGFLSVAVACGWRLPARVCRGRSARGSANRLFALRMLPCVLSGLVTAALLVPSFLLLEPHSTTEGIGEIPLALGLGCMLVFATGVFQALAVQARTSQVVANWMGAAVEASHEDAAPVFRIQKVAPAFTVAGILKPKVLMSEAASVLLTGPELQTALGHEVAHIRRRDNLKKLLFRFCAFPGMRELEAAWLESAEMAADDAAVSSCSEALDLAAALIKLSRLAPVHAPAELTTALLHSSGASINARVERLIAWEETHQLPVLRRSPWYSLAPMLAIFLCLAMTYSSMLAHMHQVTEWLVR